MEKCPNCNHKLYKGEHGKSYCKKCSYINIPEKERKCE